MGGFLAPYDGDFIFGWESGANAKISHFVFLFNIFSIYVQIN